MYGYIYETTNLINGKKYIGQKKSNIFLNENYLGSGKILNQAIKKYGKENFKVKLIEKCNSRDELNEREIYWISYYNAVNDKEYYNIGAGGTGWGNSFLYKSKEEIILYKYFKDIKGSLKAEIDRTAKSDPSMTLDDFISDEFSVDGIDGLAKELQIDKDYVKQYFKDLG